MLILLEDIQSMLKYYPNVDEKNVMSLITLDPTYKKGSNNAGTYGKWILSIANKNNGDIERKRHITDVLKNFESVKNNLKSKDIMRFKSVEELEDYLADGNNYKDFSNRQIQRQTQQHIKQGLDDSEAEKVFEDSKYEVWIPKTFAASCKLGEGTSWCTAMSKDSRYFKEYSKDGPLYIIINKSDRDEKYQFHFESMQFMDSDDSPVNITEILGDDAELYDFFMPMLKKTFNVNDDGLSEIVVNVLDIADETLVEIANNVTLKYPIFTEESRELILDCIQPDVEDFKRYILNEPEKTLARANSELYDITDDINDTLIEITGIDFSENTSQEVYDKYSNCVTAAIKATLEKIIPFEKICGKIRNGFISVLNRHSRKYDWVNSYLIKLLISLESIVSIEKECYGDTLENKVVDSITKDFTDEIFYYVDELSYSIRIYAEGYKTFKEILIPLVKKEFSVKTESLLTEDINSMKQYYKNIPDEKFQYFIELDPTYKKGSNNAGTYGKWILTLANKNKGFIENEGHVTDVLKDFEEVKNRLKSKDIMKFKSVNELQNYLDDTDNYTELSDRQKLRQIQKTVRNTDLDNEAEIVYKDEDWTIWTPKTYEASCKLGENTSWCTAYKENRDWYDRYTANGNLYIFINNNDPTEKYQLHLESNSFMDADDDPIDLLDFLSGYSKITTNFKPISDSIGTIKDDKLLTTIDTNIFDNKYSTFKQMWNEDSYSIIENEWFDDVKYGGDIVEDMQYIFDDISEYDRNQLEDKLSNYGYTIDTLEGLESIKDIEDERLRNVITNAADEMEKLSIADYIVSVFDEFMRNEDNDAGYGCELYKYNSGVSDNLEVMNVDIPLDDIYDIIGNDDYSYKSINNSIKENLEHIIEDAWNDYLIGAIHYSGVNSDYSYDNFTSYLLDNL